MTDMSIDLGDISFLIAVSFLHAFQVAGNASMVGKYRRKHKVSPPEMNGPPEFIRAIRVQANDLEFALPFQAVLWACGLVTHQAVACVLGLGYIYGRRMYKFGYLEAAEKRYPGFKLSVQCIKLLAISTGLGLVNVWLNLYAGIDVFGMLKSRVLQQMSGVKGEL